MNGKISRSDLYPFLNSEENKKTAREVFGDVQPYVIQTGWYSSPSWNWSYLVGIAKRGGEVYRVVTAFGQVEAAQKLYFSRED